MANRPRTPLEEEARECGLRLLEISEIYERGVVRYEAGAATLSIAGLVARQRRFLESVHLLADAGHRLEASSLLRSMLEFLIRQKWLELDPRRHHMLWVAHDLQARLRIDREVREHAPDEHGEAIEIMQPELRENYEEELARMEEQLEQARIELGEERVPRFPSLKEQADVTGLAFSYSLAYRFDSQTATHPSALAIEQLMQDRPDLGGIQLLSEPPPERSYADPYAVAAFILRDALAAAAALFPELQLEGLDDVTARMDALQGELRREDDANVAAR